MEKIKEILDSYNIYYDLIKGLDYIELIAFANLLSNWTILTLTLEIIVILYGDYLIKQFNLEIKYPKLTKWIQLRRKFQGYYLKWCFTEITLLALAQIIFDVFVLSTYIDQIWPFSFLIFIFNKLFK